MSFQFLFTKIFKPLPRPSNGLGVTLTEENRYDEIFTALKHPVRRQILLFIDNKVEASFTDIQQETGITDTGLMSYHLKGLSSLVEQSKRGKYQLSEVGRAGITLLQKADHEREHTSTVVHQEIERFIGLSIKKSVLFLLIAGLTWAAPLLLDLSLNQSIWYTNIVLSKSFSTIDLMGFFFATLAIMLLGVFLFTLYDRHYYAKTIKDSITHAIAFTIGISLLSILNFYQLHNFTSGILRGNETESIPWLFEILRITIFIASAPTIAYILSKRSKRQGKTKQ